MKPQVQSYFTPNLDLSFSKKNTQQAFFKMNKELTLETTVTQQELKKYWQRKSVNPATILPK